MSLPSLAEIPPPSIRLDIGPKEWEACLESWLTLCGLYLRSPAQQFSKASVSGSPLFRFLQSFYHEKARAESGDDTFASATALDLQRTCFLLVHRVLTGPSPRHELLSFDFLADLSHVHAPLRSLSKLMRDAWTLHSDMLRKSIESQKPTLLKVFDTPLEGTQSEWRRLAHLMRASPDAAAVFMTGSDFVDGLASQYDKSKTIEQHKLFVAIVYFGLLSLVKLETPNVSLLSDHLYSIKAQADGKPNVTTLLADLVLNTPLLAKLKRSASDLAVGRLLKLLDILGTYRSPSIAHSKKRSRQKLNKGKGKASGMNGEMHVHRMSLVTQVQDLFPDLGSGFVLRLLDEYNDDVEQVTAHLLDDSLPLHLQDMDRTEQAQVFDETQSINVAHLEPRSTPPPSEDILPERRNVFDDDELDRLEVDTTRLHIGKKEDPAIKAQPNKAAILAALAAFDSDDDERDDTYDVEDVGGTVDTAHPDGEPGTSAKVTQEENDTALFTAFKSSPQLSGHTFDIRGGQARQALKSETGMTDEAIEGWAIMLQRDPKRLRKNGREI